jgi:Fic-DOC domain mobile mystery protein B
MKNFNDAEGATLLSDYSELKLSWVHNQNDLNKAEAENIYFAQSKYLSGNVGNPSIWFNIGNLLTIHSAMFGNVWGWAGRFRQSVTSIGIKPNLISSRLSEFCVEINAWCNEPIELTFLEQAARIHHRLVSIHPFENGNGRFSRLIADRYLMAYKCPHSNWPYLQNNGQLRQDYIQSLKEADKGNYNPLIQLMYAYGARDIPLSKLFAHQGLKKKLSKPGKMDCYVNAITRKEYEFYDINETENNGHSALNIAIKRGYEKYAILLIKLGANLMLRDKSGCNAFETAINHEEFSIAKAIEKTGYKYDAKSKKIPYYKMYKYK